MCPGFDSRTRHHMWVEFVVGSLPCSKRFSSGYSGFPLFSKTNISKFQFDLDCCQALYHEPLAQVIVQALPVFGIKIYIFTFCLNPFSITSLGIWLKHKILHQSNNLPFQKHPFSSLLSLILLTICWTKNSCTCSMLHQTLADLVHHLPIFNLPGVWCWSLNLLRSGVFTPESLSKEGMDIFWNDAIPH